LDEFLARRGQGRFGAGYGAFGPRRVALCLRDTLAQLAELLLAPALCCGRRRLRLRPRRYLHPCEAAEPAGFELLAQSAPLEQLAAGLVHGRRAEGVGDALRVCGMSGLAQELCAALRQAMQKLSFFGRCR